MLGVGRTRVTSFPPALLVSGRDSAVSAISAINISYEGAPPPLGCGAPGDGAPAPGKTREAAGRLPPELAGM
ncbi:hypothetical protein JCM13210_01660 [Thermaerobacter litoralis]